MKQLEKHLFICTNERIEGHPKGSCKRAGGTELVAKFKECMASRGLHSKMRVQSAGCLDVCEFGAAAVVYPENIWYGSVTLSDVEEIVQKHLIEGIPVERLRIPGK